MKKAYLTKDKQGLVQLWNNKPEWNEFGQCFIGWIKKGEWNEVAVDITANEYFRELVIFETSPKLIKLQ